MATANSTGDGDELSKAEYHRRYYLANKDRLLAQCKEYRLKNGDKKRESDRAYYLANKDRIASYGVSPRGRAVQKRYREKAKDVLRERHRNWRNANREHIRAYKKRRRQNNPHLVLINRLRCRTWGAIRRALAKKRGKTIELIGCDPQELLAWIEAQFVDGMSWDRISEIHIDHVIPLAAFDLDDEVQQMSAFHYTNLRPMWAIDNKRKSCKVPGQKLFGFAYADRIAQGMHSKQKRTGRKRGGRNGDH